MSHSLDEQAAQRTILVVDDDPRIRFLVQRILARTGYGVRLASNVAEAETACAEATPDLVLLDVELPDGSGAELLRSWRARGLQMPVVMFTAHGNADREAGLLEAGADDYVDKPFTPRVLSARVANALRRASGPPPAGDVSTHGPLTLRTRERVLTVGGRRVSLTRTETALLRELMRLPGIVRPYDDLLVRVWGPPYAGQVELLHTNVYRLRRKLEPDPSHPDYLVATPGVGYCLLPEVSPEPRRNVDRDQ
jgi:two-component system KDP operon response regulator KdpE